MKTLRFTFSMTLPALVASLFLLKAQDFVNKVTGVLDPSAGTFDVRAINPA